MNVKNLRVACLAAGLCVAMLNSLAGSALAAEVSPAADVEPWGEQPPKATTEQPPQKDPVKDREITKPILQVGMPEGKDVPAVKLHGTAKRAGNGVIQLPDGDPWGWVQVGDGALKGVQELRSFTIMGWLKPASLKVGHGGNRILCCLNKDRSGIDLVCLPDGRLRLAVNEWPDKVRNDSSPGKLKVGKWTFFAVTYDGTVSKGDNVTWYFSEPMDAPKQPTVTLDRKTAYHAGAVDKDIAPLAIGNFNPTMQVFGLDRQFRGEIGAVQLFGSLAGAGGALKADEIKSRLKLLPSDGTAPKPGAEKEKPRTDAKKPAGVVLAPAASQPKSDTQKPRIITTTDLGADPDDEQSLVRLLVCANEFDNEGLIVSTSCWKKSQTSTKMLDKIVDAYGQALPNLNVHAKGFPSVEYLRSISVMGQKGYGMGDVGNGKDSPGSELIIASVDKDDPRPVWVGCWGGANTVAQAIWKVQETRSKAELSKFLGKLRVFDILGQDDAGAWITKTFPEIFYIRATGVYGWQPSDNYLKEHIQSQGPLGAVYPKRKYATEGDTPAFMHMYPNGLNDPDKIDQGGWGGRFNLTKKTGIKSMSGVKGEERKYDPYAMYGNTSEGAKAIKRWSKGYDNDFQARMAWTVTSKYSDANHHPVAVVNGDTSRRVLEVTASAGSSVTLSAKGSSDPDGNALAYSWSYYKEPSSINEAVKINNESSVSATVSVPANAGGKTIHVILEVHDDGSPNLYAYRRVIINVK